MTFTFIEVPEEKQFPSTSRGTSHVSKEVNAGIPEYSIKTQHHLEMWRAQISL